MQPLLEKVFNAFGLAPQTTALPFGSGLINRTWKVISGNSTYILQRINQAVFSEPAHIAHNIAITGACLRRQHPGYLFVMPLKTVAGDDLFFDGDNGYYRLMPFISGSHTVDVVQDPQLAFEAAGQFGKLAQLLSGFDAAALKITLPDFHNLGLRCRQFEAALVKGNRERIQQSAHIIQQLLRCKEIADGFEKIKSNPGFKRRVTHHDTKISNVLFDDAGKGMCVIDLDTLMPGYFISDAGDMMRTYLSPVSEEETDFTRIEIREEYFAAIAKGYLGQLNNELSETELRHFVYAGKFMIYMQALRFITDHINNDVYYGAAYEGHNLVRAGNQLVLLQRFYEKEDRLEKIISGIGTGARKV